MRTYEELFIVKPDATDAEIDPIVEQLTQIVANSGGNVEKTDKWGIRKLAYRVMRYNEGYYVLMQFTSTPEVVKEIERRLRVSDLVFKFLTVRIDEKLKKIAKRKKARDKRAARKPALVVHPASPVPVFGEPVAHPAPAMPGAPAPAEAAPVAAAPEPVKEAV
jgi:small subunit ribosomal protein S6